MVSLDLALSVCKFASIILTGCFAVLALVRPYRDKEGTLTTSGRIALGGAIASAMVGALSQSLELERSHQQSLTAQKATQDELARFERLLREVQRSSPLVSMQVRLTVDKVPDEIRQAISKGMSAAESSPDQDWFKDLLEHHNADGDDVQSLIQSELNKQVIQPFIAWLGSDRFVKQAGILAIGMDKNYSALLCAGMVDGPGIISREQKVTSLPSGILIGRELEFQLGTEKPERSYKRLKFIRPSVGISVEGEAVVLVIDTGLRALDDSMYRYSRNAAITAAISENVKVFSWSPSSPGTVLDKGDAGALQLPFDSNSVHESITAMDWPDPKMIEAVPQLLRHMRLQIIPNGNGHLSRTYDLPLSSAGKPIEGSREDEPRGYLRIWHGQSK
jgi:hypothetical protein